MNRMLRLDEIEELKDAKHNYELNLDKLKIAFTINGGTFYFNGHQSKEIDKDILPSIREAYINYYKTKCEISLQELSNLEVDVRKEREALEKICIKDM